MINLSVKCIYLRMNTMLIISFFIIIDELDERLSNGDWRMSMPLKHGKTSVHYHHLLLFIFYSSNTYSSN